MSPRAEKVMGERPRDRSGPLDPAQQVGAGVALDIGPGRGALVIYPLQRYRGREIELSDTEGYGHRVHTGVHERAVPAGPAILTAIFGSLPPGDYVVWSDENTAGPTVRVEEASVAEVALP